MNAGGEVSDTGTLEDMRALKILEVLEDTPEVKQADLAAQLGVAVGTVNWLLKRLAAKGYVKVKRIGQWRWRYLITPQGAVAKTRLTKTYIERSMQLYRETRQRAQELLRQVEQAGHDRVRIVGGVGNELVDICRLTCLAQGIKVVSVGENSMSPTNPDFPKLCIDGRELSLEWPKEGRD